MHFFSTFSPFDQAREFHPKPIPTCPAKQKSLIPTGKSGHAVTVYRHTALLIYSANNEHALK